MNDPRRRLINILIAVIALSTIMAGVAAATVDETHRRFDRDAEEDCDEWAPAAYSSPLESQDLLTLEVYVLLNGISLPRGQQIMAQVATSYKDIGIDLVSTYQEISIVPDEVMTPPYGDGEPAHGAALMAAVKEAVSGARPWGSDVVYALLADPIVAATAGFADCIGGVRYPARAFAVGGAAVNPADEQGWADTNESAKIATHEIAHLLGAHHHYANCAETDKSANLLNELAFCTVMINDIGLASFQWSTLEAAAVRGHVAQFAIGATMGPEPVHPRAVSLKITKKWVAKGAVTSDPDPCTSSVDIEIQRLIGSDWVIVTTEEAAITGNYSIQIPEGSGSYRAVIPADHFVGERYRETCAEATSALVTR